MNRYKILNDCLPVKRPSLSSGQSCIEAALELKVGESLQDGYRVVHLCGNKDCCNPWHLIGDKTDKLFGIMQDENYVYQPPTGENTANSKLTKEDVLIIVQLLKDEVPQRHIARRFNTTQQAISSIATGRTWSEVTGFKRPDADTTWERLTRKR
jgi:hypothetical protein